MGIRGHLYIINGDVTAVACDAWLLPTDRVLAITEAFDHALNDEQLREIEELRSSGFVGSVWEKSGGTVGCIKIRSKSDSDPSCPTLWIGDIGRADGTPLNHYADRAREFVQESVLDIRKSRPNLRRRPLIALNVIGSGKGGKRRTRGPLLKVLIKALLECSEEFQADIVLVTWGSVMYSAAQKVRMELASSLPEVWAALPDELMETGERLSKLASSGNLVVFAGAGVSRDAGVPLWGELLERIARGLDMLDQEVEELKILDPRDQATVIMNRGEDRAQRMVEEYVTRPRYSLLHGLITSLPVREFVTTNFDSLLESSARTAQREMKIITQDPIRSGDRWLLKLHGDLGGAIVLARADYLSALRSHRPLRGLVQSLLLQKHMLFIGYSLSDEDFHDLMHDLRQTLSDNVGVEIGTVLTLHRAGFGRSIWPELAFVHAEVESENSGRTEDDELARRIAVLLDYIGCRAASDTRFVLDESMGDVKSPEDEDLADLLKQIDALVNRHGVESGKWLEIRRFLDHFRDQD